jgi:hypothetical protein
VSLRTYLKQEIMRRAIWLRLASAAERDDGEMISHAEATRLAAKQVADERKRTKAALQQHSTTTEITVSNARQVFLARLAALAANMKATAGIVPSTPSDPTIRKHTDDVPSERITKAQSEPEPPADQVIGIVSNVTSTYELIPSSEYHTSIRCFDRATDNWRRSIEHNERVAAEREQRRRERIG